MSGADPLDRYFRTQAGQDIGKRVASCFVLTESEGGAPIGFYTLAATSIALANLSPTLAKRLPRYPILPAALLGRLALNNNYQRRGLGQLLLMDAFIRTLRSEIAIFAFVVNAKDNNAKISTKLTASFHLEPPAGICLCPCPRLQSYSCE